MSVRTILYLHYHTKGMSIGGGEKSLLTLLTNLDRDKFRAIVVLPGISEFHDAATSVGIEVYTVPFVGFHRTSNVSYWLRVFLNYIHVVCTLAALIKQENVDLVHANSIMTQIYGGIAGFMTKRPVVYHVRNVIRLDVLNRLLLRFNTFFATKVITTSEATKEMLKRAGVNMEKCVTIYDPVDLRVCNTVAKGELRRELGLKDNPLVGMVGAIDWIKGQDIFIEAAKLLSRCHPEARFLIIGSLRRSGEKYEHELKELVKQLKLQDRVLFLGYRPDIENMMADLDVLVCPSRMEAFGRAIVEAMALKKPVIATRVGGIPEVVVDGETGILVESENPGSLAEAVGRLLSGADIAKSMGEMGRKRAENLFSLDLHIRKVVDEYLAILG